MPEFSVSIEYAGERAPVVTLEDIEALVDEAHAVLGAAVAASSEDGTTAGCAVQAHLDGHSAFEVARTPGQLRAPLVPQDQHPRAGRGHHS